MSELQDRKPLCLYPHAAANEPVVFREGGLELRYGGQVRAGSGRLVLRFVPSTGLCLEVELPEPSGPQPGKPVEVMMGDVLAHALVGSFRMSISGGAVTTYVKGPVGTVQVGDPGARIITAGFQILNFPEFTTPASNGFSFGFPPQVAELQADGWCIGLTAVEQSGEMFTSLDETGGYGFTHAGHIQRIDGAPFTATDADRLMDVLRGFLSFARGADCGPAVRWGVAPDGQVVWQRWGSPVVDPWKVPDNWFEEQHGNLLAEIFPAFFTISNDSDLGEPFSLALHWYERSNLRAGGMERAIILGLTSLDLLSALVVVDRHKTINEKKFDKLAAAVKLTKLLGVLKVPLTIPAKYSALSAFASANGWADAATALAEIRHGYVHANRERRKVVLSASNIATFQAWQLAMWYQELALIYFLGHKGEYRNRVTAEWLGNAEKVPWA